MKGRTNNPNGRPKGVPNKRTQQLAELAKEHDADPALFLIQVMKGDLRNFGYEDRLVAREREYRLKKEKHDKKVEEARKLGKNIEPLEELRELTEAEMLEANLLDLETRKEAAKELMPYLYGKRKPIDSNGDDSTSVFDEILSAIDGTK